VTRADLEAVGLYDPDDEHADERLALLEFLLGQATRTKRCGQPPVRLVLRGLSAAFP